MTIKNARKQAAAIIRDAISERVRELMDTPAFKELKAGVSVFENDPYTIGSCRTLDDMGMLESVMELRLETFSEEYSEVIAELLKECSEVVYFAQSQNSQGKHEWTMSQCLGEPVVINFSDPRRCYAIYSSELSLKVNYSELIGEDDSEKLHHAKLIIEQAMRREGVFSNIVQVGYYNEIIREVEMLGTLNDSDIRRQIAEIEASQEK